MIRERVAALLAGLWAGVILCIAALAAPSAFATLVSADAGRFVGRVLTLEAYTSLAVALLLIVIDRERGRRAAEAGASPVPSADVLMLMGTLFCTIAGHFAVQPMMAAARAGQGPWSFGALHAMSGGLFALKGLLVLVLAWRLSAGAKS